MNKEEDKRYLFNPFLIKNANEIELSKIYLEEMEKLIKDPITLYHYATNIEIYSNCNYILGEVIARLSRDILELKTNIKIDSSLVSVEERNKWDTEKNGKPPAMSYFEALGTRFCQASISQLSNKECSLKRFKNAYESTSEKMNALKKKMEAIKFEEFN